MVLPLPALPGEKEVTVGRGAIKVKPGLVMVPDGKTILTSPDEPVATVAFI